MFLLLLFRIYFSFSCYPKVHLRNAQSFLIINAFDIQDTIKYQWEFLSFRSTDQYKIQLGAWLANIFSNFIYGDTQTP